MSNNATQMFSEIEPADLEHHLQPATFITGSAGTGKTHAVRNLLKDCCLTATTAAAADNIGLECMTVHKALGFRTEEKIDECLDEILDSLRQIKSDGCRALLIDEISMMKPHTLDVIYESCRDVDLPLVVVGDFAQLPPVDISGSGAMAFDAKCWHWFEGNTIRLPWHGDEAKMRQGSDPVFKAALDSLRRGEGKEAMPFLLESGVKFVSKSATNFPGVTLFARNDPRERFNAHLYAELKGREQGYRSMRQGKQDSRFKDVPEVLKLKVGARVMVITNVYDAATHEIVRYNGEQAVITTLCEDGAAVKLLKTGEDVYVGYVEVKNYEGHEWREWWDGESQSIVTKYLPIEVGKIRFIPLELSWGVTYHKSQGSSHDQVQAVIKNGDRLPDGMVYVGASRCRTGAGLTFVGTHADLIRSCKASPKVRAAGYL